MSEQKGLYDKFMVIKVVDGTVIENCFILRPDKDPAAVKALQAYAAATENKVLAADLFAWVGRPMQKPMTQKELRDIIDPGFEVVAWCEAKGYEGVHPNIWFRGLVQGPDVDEVAVNQINWRGYSKTWRAWATKPTREEQAAAPWEE